MRGILKAGFGLAGATEWRANRTLALAATGEQARACTRVLGLRLSQPACSASMLS